MADNKPKPTIFQRLQYALGGGTTSTSGRIIANTGNRYNIQSDPNAVVATASSPLERDMRLTQMQQQQLLSKQWIKAQNDINNKALMNANEIRFMYRDCELMDAMPEIGTALDIYAEEACALHDDGQLIKVTSSSERVKGVLQDLFTNRLAVNTTLPMITRATCKYGNDYMLLNLDDKNGIMGWSRLPVAEIERYDNGTASPYQFVPKSTSLDTIDLNQRDDTRFIWVGQNDHMIGYRNWQVAHFRMLYDSQFLPYGCIVGDSRIETEFGYKEIQDICIGDKVWTFNVNTQERELSNVTMMMDKGVKDVYRLQTFHNFIEATDDHKFLIYEEGKLIYKELKDVKIGDLIVISNLIKKGGVDIKIDKSYPTQFEANLKKSMRWWNDNIDAIPEYVDEKFAKFFGFMIGDGWISNNKEIFFATGEYDSFNNEFASYLSSITNQTPKFLRPTSCNENRNYEFSQVKICSKSLVLIMRRMGFSGKFNEKRIPSWVYQSSYNIRKAFLSGLMIADGSYNIDKYNCLRCSIEMSNEQLIKDIKILVQSLGYKSSIINSRNRIGKTTTLKDGYKIVTKHESFYFYFYESFNKQEKKYELEKRLSEGFKTEKVRKITYIGQKRTYDITIENENSNFFANGIVTHNCSILNKARRHFRMLSMMEDMMLLYRLDRSVERRVFNIDVGNIDENDVQAYIEDIANTFKRTPVIDPMTGQVDTRKKLLNIGEDFFIPRRPGDTSSKIETLPAGQNLTAMDDIKYIQNKIFTALRIPKAFLNFEESQGDGKNLSLLDVRFMRTVNRVQQMLLMELNKVAIIHLYLLGLTDELTNFKLTMHTPSSQAEMLEIENLSKKITTAKDAVSDPGGGLPITSVTWAMKNILKLSNKEIQGIFEEQRLESALAIELQKTQQIIKRTHLYDPVDNVYGEPGAEYQEGEAEEGPGGDGGPVGGGGLGGAPIGDGDFDFGGDGEDGSEGEMPMDDAAAQDDGGAIPDAGGPEPSLGESILNKAFKVHEKKKQNRQSQYNAKIQSIIEQLSNRYPDKDEDGNIINKNQNSDSIKQTLMENMDSINDIKTLVEKFEVVGSKNFDDCFTD